VEAGQNSAATVHIDVNTATTGIQTTRSDLAVGEIVDVDIVINGAVNLKTFNLVVTFPENILEIQEAGVTKGGFFPYPEVTIQNPEGKVSFIKDLDTTGKVEVTGGVMDNNDAVSGDGILFHLRFKVLSTEPAYLQFLVADTQLLQDNTGARPEAIDNPVALGKAYGAAINTPAHPADKNSDYIIDGFELLDYINLWKQGLVGDFELLDTIALWAAGHYYWDESEQKFMPGIKP